VYEGNYSKDGIREDKKGIMLNTIEEIKQYLDKDYWEKGNKSGYRDTYLNLWWNGRWCQCLNRVIPLYDKRLLDLGCGIGGFVTVSVLFGADSYGVDLSRYAIEKYREECKKLHLPFDRCFEGSCHDLSRWPNEYFDIIYSNQVFEHLPEQYVDKMIAEIYRVAKKECICWFSLQMPDQDDIKDPNCKDETHVTLKSKRWWNDKFIKTGFIEDRQTDELLHKVVTGYDHYSFFKEYQWRTLVYRKKD
jgi:SAM-dependent methyltransferase